MRSNILPQPTSDTPHGGNATTDTTISQNDQSVNISISDSEKNDTSVSDTRYSFGKNYSDYDQTKKRFII